jgi:hypothetical protein
MNLAAKLGLKFPKCLWAVGLAFALAMTATAQDRSESLARGRTQAGVNETESVRASIPVAPEPPATGNRSEVTSYVMDFDGDHSLDLATVIEQAIGAYSRYTVHLHLASGAEQSIAVTAPPGGLRLEMKDMTGDKVRNDLILRPALMHWLPTVLVNDGHDHFAVVISNRLSDFLSCGQDLKSGRNDARASAALMSSGFKARGFTTSRELFPQLREITTVSSAEAIVPRWNISINSGRSPPALIPSL